MSTKETARDLLLALAAADDLVAQATGLLKARKEEYERVADRLFALMEEQGTETIRNSEVGLQVSVGETETDTIEDYEEFARFVLRHKLLHLLQRRISSTALREYEESTGRRPPGLGKFKRKRLHVTKFTK